MKKYTIEIERDGKFFVAQCIEHPNCFTQGRTLRETLRNMNYRFARSLRSRKDRYAPSLRYGQEVLELMLE